MDTRQPTIVQLIAEGAHARTIGRPKDSCPYAADSPERKAWLEGYDGTLTEDTFEPPIADD
jgi:ribosome modulation factor